MGAFKIYVSVIDFTNKILLWFVGILLLLTFSFLVSQVFFRYVLNASLSWTSEAARFMTIWIVFLGTSLSLRNKSLIAVEAITQFIPHKLRLVFKIAVLMLSVVFALFLIIYGIQMAITVSDQKSVALDLPMWIPYLAVPLGAFHLILNITVEIIEMIEKEVSTK